VRVHVVDPSAYSPPYDHELCGALAAAGAEVELHTSEFLYGEVPEPSGYVVRRDFYRHGGGAAGSRMRFAAKLAQHVPDMLRYRRTAGTADVVHFQWLTVQPLDVHLLPRAARRGGKPLVLTSHDVLPREPRPGQLGAQRRLYERVDAVVVHSEHGRDRLVGELGIEPARVRVIPHGPLTHLTAPAQEDPLPPALAAVEVPVVLFFGLLRPYKGLDLLLEAWREIHDAELWIVGNARMPIEGLVSASPDNVRWVPRFVADSELPAYFRRADLVVLPYREIDQSGVLFTTLAFGRPLLLSDVGGFPEVAGLGGAELFAAGDAAALHAALASLLADPARRDRLAAGAAAAAAGPYSWERIAASTLDLYGELGAPGR
jgi:glycosyltransferase involved in cell wall biosynthesis